MFSLKLQELIHRFELGAGARFVRGLLLAFAFLGVALLYDSLCYRNLWTEEAMDAAQLARNIAEGRGFSTQVIRPFSLHLMSQHHAGKKATIPERFPDLVNAPVYPLLLAPVVKMTPVQDFSARPMVAWSDLAIAVFNQALLLVALGLVYWVARRWFDRMVAIMAALLFGITELYWRFSISGLSTNFLIVLVLLLALCLSKLEERSRLQGPLSGSVWLAIATGLLLAAIALTRYSCAFLIIPTLIFVAAFVAQGRAALLAVIIGVFVLAFTPWISRNWIVSGTPFGIAGYAPMEQTRMFPEDRLQRSLHPQLSQFKVSEYTRKLTTNLREIVTSDLPRLGGSWIAAFFLVGMLLPFRNPTLTRARWFVILGIITLVPVQALVRTQNWTASPDVNSENLLILFSPLVLIFGTGVFFVLLDSIQFSSAASRYSALAAFVIVAALPLMAALLPPRPPVVNYPPYYPPRLHDIGQWLDGDDLVVTDVPAAIAWYGHRQALGTTTGGMQEFLEVHDFIKPVRAVYLTSATIDRKVLTAWMRGEKNGWGAFALETGVKEQVPNGFPLKHANGTVFVDGQILLMDYDRWRAKAQNPLKKD